MKNWSNTETGIFMLWHDVRNYSDKLETALADIRKEDNSELDKVTNSQCTAAAYVVVGDILERKKKEWEDLLDQTDGFLRDLYVIKTLIIMSKINKLEIAEDWGKKFFEYILEKSLIKV